MIPEKALCVNSRIEIALNAGDNQIFGRSLIQEIFEDSFAAMIPLYKGRSIYLEAGDEVTVSVFIDQRRYIFASTVLQKDIKTRMVVLQMPSKLISADRRRAVRIKTMLPAKYDICPGNRREDWETMEPAKHGNIINLSSKGLVLSLGREMAIGTLMILILDLRSEAINMRTKLLAEVVRCERVSDRCQVGVKYLSVSPQQEDLIIKYIFHCLRKMIRIKKGD